MSATTTNVVNLRSGRQVRIRRFARSAGFYLVVVAFLVPMLVPYLEMLATSLRSRLQNLEPSLLFAPTLDNFSRLLGGGSMIPALVNSFIVAAAATAIGLALGLPCAYGVARYRIRHVGLLVLIVRMVPGIALLVPWYLVLAQFHIIGTYWALILSHLAVTLPLVVWLTMGFFAELPVEILDAAKVDGCSARQTFVQIALPLTLPGVIAAAVLAFISSWNNFLFSLILRGNLPMAPIQVYNQIQELSQNWGALAAASIATTWPVILLSLPFTKNLVRGLTAGAVKG